MNIYFVNGSRTGEKFVLKPEGVKVGRETDNDISILEAGLSRYHARLEKKGENWVIIDLNSTNGVKVNGVKIQEETPLKDGDELKLGSQLFRFGDASETIAGAQVASPEPLPKADSDQKSVGFSFDDAIKPPEPLSNEEDALIKPPEPLKEEGDAGVKITPPDTSESSKELQNQSTASESPFKFGQPDALKPDEDSSALEEKDQKISEERKEEIKSFFDAFSKNADKENAEHDTSFDDNDWFSGKKPETKAKKESGKSKGKFKSNLIFYVAVIAIAVIFVSVYIKFIEGSPDSLQKEKVKVGLNKQQKKERQLNNFLLVYKKEIFSKDNIFRYYLKVERGEATVELDDLKHKRRFTEPAKELKTEQIEMLLEAVRDTGFMGLTQEADGLAVDDNEVNRHLTVGYDSDIKTIVIKNKFAPNSFEKIESIIEEFSRDFLGTPLVLTVEEMKAYAESSFSKAEQLFMNREARPENLNEAIKRYKVVMEQLDTFSPKPQIWDTSRKRVAEAKEILDKTIKNHMFNAVHAYKMKNYNTARQEFAAVMDMLDANDKRYQKARNYVNELDNYLKRVKKKRK